MATREKIFHCHLEVVVYDPRICAGLLLPEQNSFLRPFKKSKAEGTTVRVASLNLWFVVWIQLTSLTSSLICLLIVVDFWMLNK